MPSVSRAGLPLIPVFREIHSLASGRARRCVLFTPGSWFDPRSLVFEHEHDRPQALMPVPIGHTFEIALFGSPDGALHSNRPHGEVLPITRAVALSLTFQCCLRSSDGRKTRDGRLSWATSSFYDAVGCRILSSAPRQHRCAVWASGRAWMGVRALGSDFAAQKRPIGMHV